jgi:death-on-curing protein
MTSVKEVEEFHQILIDKFGGSHGIRDLASLESALGRPFQTFDERDLYPTPIHKAAPFIDGNKRTGYVLLRIYLIDNGLDVQATQEEKYAFVLNIASGLSKFDNIVEWLLLHVVKTNG